MILFMAAYLLSYQILLIVQLFIDQHRKSTKALHVVTDNRGSPVYGPILEQTKILSKESPKCLQSCYYPTNSTQCLFRAASRSQESSPCKVRRVGHGVSHEEDKLSTILQIIIFLQSSQFFLTALFILSCLLLPPTILVHVRLASFSTGHLLRSSYGTQTSGRYTSI